MTNTGKINVTADNIFPIIKKFLYSDHEIFLRELVSNAVDATTKLKTLSSIGEHQGELGDLTIEIKADKEAKTLSIIDKGIGMTEEEINKYINEVAFSGAEEFVQKYKDKTGDTGIIGHFGLGFYSAFMVASKVEIFTKSHRAAENEPGVHWSCTGTPEFELTAIERKERGTEIRLHIAEDSTEFLEEYRISELLTKYGKFLPVPIQFGTKEVTEKDDDKEVKKTVPNIINNPSPAWIKQPSELQDEDYKKFYRELYPYTFEEPLFHIHLNVDYPFNLTGILYFPRIKPQMEVKQNKIQLYQNQVFVTEALEGIVPDFLTLLHGVIDSKDIPLNVSRSYLQADGNVKKISSHITKKVADKLEEMFKNNREDFQSKWNDVKIFIEYGMLSEEKFFERAKKFNLYPTVDGEFYTLDELKEKLKDHHTDKDENLVILYTNDKEQQYSYIRKAKDLGYTVLLLDSPLSGHSMQKLEYGADKIKFARIDSDTIDKLIPKKDDTKISTLEQAQKDELKKIVEETIEKEKYTIAVEDLSVSDEAFVITQPEFMRRMKEMSATGGGGFMGMGNFPETYNLTINGNNPLSLKILEEQDAERKQSLIKHAVDLALISQNLLKGEALDNFIKRSYSMLN